MKRPRLLKNPIILLHMCLWVGIMVFHAVQALAPFIGLGRAFDGGRTFDFTFGLYLFFGLTALAALPVCCVSLFRAISARDWSLGIQSGIGAVMASSVLGLGLYVFCLIGSSPR